MIIFRQQVATDDYRYLFVYTFFIIFFSKEGGQLPGLAIIIYMSTYIPVTAIGLRVQYAKVVEINCELFFTHIPFLAEQYTPAWVFTLKYNTKCKPFFLKPESEGQG